MNNRTITRAQCRREMRKVKMFHTTSVVCFFETNWLPYCQTRKFAFTEMCWLSSRKVLLKKWHLGHFVSDYFLLPNNSGWKWGLMMSLCPGFRFVKGAVSILFWTIVRNKGELYSDLFVVLSVFLSSGLLARNIQCVIWTTVLSLSVSLSIYHQLIYHCMDSVDNQMTKRLFGHSVVHSKVYFVAVYFCFWGDLVVLLFWFVFTLVKIWVKELDSKLPYSADLFTSFWSLYLSAVS